MKTVGVVFIILFLWPLAGTAQVPSDEEQLANVLFATMADNRMAPDDRLRLMATAYVINAVGHSGERIRAADMPAIEARIDELYEEWTELGNPFLNPYSFENTFLRLSYAAIEAQAIELPNGLTIPIGQFAGEFFRRWVNPPELPPYGAEQANAAAFAGSPQFQEAQYESKQHFLSLRFNTRDNAYLAHVVDDQFRKFKQPIPYSITDDIDQIVDKGGNADVAALLRENGSSMHEVVEHAETIISNQATLEEKLDAQENLLRATHGLVRRTFETTQQIQQDLQSVQEKVDAILAAQDQNQKQILDGQAEILDELGALEGRLVNGYLAPIYANTRTLLRLDSLRQADAQQKARRELIYAGAESGVFLLEFAISKSDPDLARKVGGVGRAAIKITRALNQFSKVAGTSADDLLALGASSLTLAGGIVTGLNLIMNAFSTGPTFEEVVLEQLTGISEQIAALGEVMVDRFDRLDENIATLIEQSNTILTTLDFRSEEISAQVVDVRRELNDLQASVGAVRVTLDRYFEEGLRAEVRTCQDIYLGYEGRLGVRLPFQDGFDIAEACFWNHGVTRARGALSGIGAHTWNAPEVVTNLHALEVNGQNSQLTYLSQLLAERYGVSGVPTSIPSLHDWRLGVDSYLQLAEENADYASQVSEQRLIELERTGETIERGLASLHAPGEGVQRPALTVFDAYVSSVARFREALADAEDRVLRTSTLADYLTRADGKPYLPLIFGRPLGDDVSELPGFVYDFHYCDVEPGSDGPQPDPHLNPRDQVVRSASRPPLMHFFFNQQLAIERLTPEGGAPMRNDPPVRMNVCVRPFWADVEQEMRTIQDLPFHDLRKIQYRATPVVRFEIRWEGGGDDTQLMMNEWRGQRIGWTDCLINRPEDLPLPEDPSAPDFPDLCSKRAYWGDENIDLPESELSVASPFDDYTGVGNFYFDPARMESVRRLSETVVDENESYKNRLRSAFFQEMANELERAPLADLAAGAQADQLALAALIQTVYPESYTQSDVVGEFLEGEGLFLVRPTFVAELYEKAAELGYRYNVRHYVDADFELGVLNRLLVDLTANEGEHLAHTTRWRASLRSATNSFRYLELSPDEGNATWPEEGLSITTAGGTEATVAVGVRKHEVSGTSLSGGLAAHIATNERVVARYQLVGDPQASFQICFEPGLRTRDIDSILLRRTDAASQEWEDVPVEWSVVDVGLGGRRTFRGCSEANASQQIALSVINALDDLETELRPVIEASLPSIRTVRGRDFQHVDIEVTNWELFSDEMFAPAPDLPPCGANTNASRTWVSVHDADNDHRLNSFCGFRRAEDLSSSVWFSRAVGTDLPKNVELRIHDRSARIVLTSDAVPVPEH